VTDKPISLLAEEDLAGLGGLLKASGDVDCVARGVEVALRWVADDDFARVDPRADGQGDAALAE